MSNFTFLVGRDSWRLRESRVKNERVYIDESLFVRCRRSSVRYGKNSRSVSVVLTLAKPDRAWGRSLGYYAMLARPLDNPICD